MSETTRQPISRRTVAKGAAWSAPVILGGVAAPTYAASGSTPIITAGPACKLPGESCSPFSKGYIFLAKVENTSTKDIYLYAPATVAPIGEVDFTLKYNGAAVGSVTYEPGDTIMIPAGQTVVLTLNTTRSNSGNLDFSFEISFEWGHTQNRADDPDHMGDPISTTVFVPGTKPCKNCQPPAA